MGSINVTGTNIRVIQIENSDYECSFYQRRASPIGKVDEVESNCHSANEDFNGSRMPKKFEII